MRIFNMRRLSNEEIINRGLERKIGLRKEWSLELKMPPIPADLFPEAVQYFKEIGDTLISAGVLKVVDGGQLATLAMALAERDKVKKQLDIEGFVLKIEKTVKTQKGTTTTITAKKNPLFDTYMSLGRLINSMNCKLGLNPLSRSRILNRKH